MNDEITDLARETLVRVRSCILYDNEYGAQLEIEIACRKAVGLWIAKQAAQKTE